MRKIFILVSVLLITLTMLVGSPALAYMESFSYIVIETNSCRVLGGANIDAKLPMASTTKIMTALLVLENAELDEIVSVKKEAVGVEGSSIYLKENEKFSVEELLYGLMLRSGNDSAVALAIHISGSLDKFVKLMNDRAQELGAENTNFTNPHGLHDELHYTTAYDLALISAEAMKTSIFKEVTSTKSYKRANGQVFYNKNKMLSLLDDADGIKTGFTKNSGRCLVSSATRDNMQVICVVLNCPDMWNNSITYINKAFDAYKLYPLVETSYTSAVVKVIDGKKESTHLMSSSEFYYPLKLEECKSIKTVENAPMTLKAPINNNEVKGSLDIYLDNRLLFSANLCTIEVIAKKGIIDRLRDLLD